MASKYIQFDKTNNKLIIGKNSVDVSEVQLQTSANVAQYLADLPDNERQYASGVTLPRSMYKVTAQGKAEMKRIKDERHEKNIKRPIDDFFYSGGLQEASEGIKKAVDDVKEASMKEGLKIGVVRSGRGGSYIPRFGVIEDVRAKNGKPVSLTKYLKIHKNTNHLTPTQRRLLKFLRRLNSATSLYKQFTKQRWIDNKDRLEPGLGLKSLIAKAKIRRRFKNTLKRIAKKQGVEVETVDANAVDRYVDAVGKAVTSGADKAAQMLKIKMNSALKVGRGQNLNVVGYDVGLTSAVASHSFYLTLKSLLTPKVDVTPMTKWETTDATTFSALPQFRTGNLINVKAVFEYLAKQFEGAGAWQEPTSSAWTNLPPLADQYTAYQWSSTVSQVASLGRGKMKKKDNFSEVIANMRITNAGEPAVAALTVEWNFTQPS